MTENRKIVVVIPTRNRSGLAENAVRSILAQDGAEVDIVVSDNSTDAGEMKKLSAFCCSLPEGTVNYIKPDEPLPMSEHWNWALDRALELSDAYHVIYLTDRMVFVPNALKAITTILEQHPEKVISYSWDLIRDTGVPYITFQVIRTGKVFELDSSDLMDRAAESIFNYSLPRMLNSCCTRKTIERIRERFGAIFFSDNPDFNFAYTCLDVEDSIIYCDYPLIISYGLGVSNGTNFNRGLFKKSDTTKDFMQTMKFDGVNELVAKLPLTTTQHIAFEYELIKKRSSKPLKELDQDRLLRRVLTLVVFYEDPEEKKKALKQVYEIDKAKYPVHLARTYFDAYKERGLNKMKSKLGSHDAFDLMKHHQTLEEAMSEIKDTPRAATTGRAYFVSRMGRYPREIDIDVSFLGAHREKNAG